MLFLRTKGHHEFQHLLAVCHYSFSLVENYHMTAGHPLVSMFLLTLVLVMHCVSLDILQN